MSVTLKQAKDMAKYFNIDHDVVPLRIWRKAMNIEMEHGKIDKETNVTNDDLEKTAKIALAHLKEYPNYYVKLIQMENRLNKYWTNKVKPSPTQS